MPSRSPSIQSTSRLDRLLEFYQELDPNYNPYKHHQNKEEVVEEDDAYLSSPDSLSVAGRTDSESWAFDVPINGQNVFSSNNNDLPVAPYYVNKVQAEAFAVGREHLQFPLLPSELTCDPMYSKASGKQHNANQQHAPPLPPPFNAVTVQPAKQLPPPPLPTNTVQPNVSTVPAAMPAPPPAYHRPPPYITKDQPIRAVKNLKVNALKVENASRFMPPPPPSMQAARVMSVVGIQKHTTIYQYRTESDGRTCPAEGEFAFLAKTPGTSDWVRGGYGATYAATMAEGAPAESFTQVDIHDESFQSLLRVMMRWYVRVAGLFGCVSPSSATSDAPSVNVAAARSHLRPSERLPRSYFARTAVPPCPSPFAYFTTAEQGDLHVVSDLQAFVAWHDAVHGWWDMHVRPRSVGHVLHKQLCQALKIKATK